MVVLRPLICHFEHCVNEGMHTPVLMMRTHINLLLQFYFSFELMQQVFHFSPKDYSFLTVGL